MSEELDERREARVRNARIGQGFLKQVAGRLASIKVDELSPTDVARWMEVAIKLAQQGTLREASPRRRSAYLDSVTVSELEIVPGDDDD
jgi:hypothetical protein